MSSHAQPVRVLIEEKRLQARIAELADEISRDYGDAEELILVGVLKGAFVFLADLARRLTVERQIEFIAVSSYGHGTTTTGAVRLILDVRTPVEGKHVLVVEDIVDSGYTLAYLEQLLRARGPASLEACALLRKPGRQKVGVSVRYVGFDIPDVWVVGYGLDIAERKRMLPFIGAIEPE